MGCKAGGAEFAHTTVVADILVKVKSRNLGHGVTVLVGDRESGGKNVIVLELDIVSLEMEVMCVRK